VTESTDPRRGEIWLASFGAARRGEPGKNRPAIVVSVDDLLVGVEHELIAVVPLSSSLPRSAMRPRVGSEAGIDAQSVAIPRGVRGIARSRLLRRVGEASSETLAEVEVVLATVLGLEKGKSG